MKIKTILNKRIDNEECNEEKGFLIDCLSAIECLESKVAKLVSGNKQVAFLNYAKKKKWDASLCIYDGKYIAILNPVNKNRVFQAESEVSCGDAIDQCKEILMESRK